MNFFDCLKSFFIRLLAMKISDELLTDIAMDFTDKTKREKLIAEAVLAFIAYKKSEKKGKFLQESAPRLGYFATGYGKRSGVINFILLVPMLLRGNAYLQFSKKYLCYTMNKFGIYCF